MIAITHSLFHSLHAALLLLLLLSWLPRASAQVGTLLDHSKLPACAFNCQTLLNAQAVCVPPSTPESSQSAYQACFCQSGYLTAFKATPTDICAGLCTAPDLQKIQTWYDGLCAAGAPVVTPGGQAAVVTATAAAGSAVTGTSGSTGAKSSSGPSPSWYDYAKKA